ncbi:uncharacterized protein LOC134650372 [Cydia amplana]|uniref:uncharacterized protein LOC134650372 n=1 Tax=Cydia amplana TaxID=1869771 RepID=UPI002FE5BCE3
MESDLSDEEYEDGTVRVVKKRKVEKRAQKYKFQWEADFPWLKKDETNDFNAKCTACGVVIVIGTGGVGQIKQHENTNTHKKRMEIKKTSGLLSKFLTTPSTSNTACLNNNTENVSAAELALTYHAIKHNLSYNSMDCLVKLNKIIYVDSSTATSIRLGRTKMEALVTEVLGPYSLQGVVDDLKNEDQYFSLQTDASNKKNIKLFPLVVQYFSAKNGLQTKLLDFYENINESADGMFSSIKESLANLDLTFENVSGFSADNTNANFGARHSLFTNIREEVPDVLKGNCHAHIIHNCVKRAMDFLSYDIENVILKIYSHFAHSAVRREDLKKFVEAADG